MSLNERDRALWDDVRELELRRFDAINELFKSASDPVAVLTRALEGDVWDRVAALTLLLEAGDRERIVHVFPALLDLACGMHGLLDLVRNVIRRTPRAWLDEHLAELVLAQLESQDDAGYRRLAELLSGLEFNDVLNELVRIALDSGDPNIREVGEDFAQRPRPLRIFG